MRISILPLTVAAALAAGGIVATAAQESHDAHHPGETPAQTVTPSPQPANPAARPGQMGMMGGDVMMGAGGMMPMMGMMMGGMQAMGMANMTMPGMDMADRIDGRLAFLRVEMKITDDQAKPWSSFADALRANAKRLADLRSTGQDTAGLAQQLGQQERWYAARLEGIRAIKAAFTPLYTALSPDQQKTADQIMGPHLGLMPMAMMGMAGMPQGAMPMQMPQGGMPMQMPQRGGMPMQAPPRRP